MPGDMLDNSQCNDMPERKSAAQVKVVNRGSAKWCPLTDAEDSDQQFGLKVYTSDQVLHRL